MISYKQEANEKKSLKDIFSKLKIKEVKIDNNIDTLPSAIKDILIHTIEEKIRNTTLLVFYLKIPSEKDRAKLG